MRMAPPVLVLVANVVCLCLAMPACLATSEEAWHKIMHRMAGLHVENQRVGDVLGPILNYKFRSPISALRKGVVYIGHNARLRRAVKTLLSGGHANGRPFKIGVIGGSISWGHAASVRGETDWFSLFSKWVLQAFPQANVVLRNGCVPGTPSGYMTMCLELSCDNDTDIVFAEYALNDGFNHGHLTDNAIVKTYERLIRRVVSRGPHPPMIIMQVTNHGVAFPRDSRDWRPFHHTHEGQEAELAQYYDIPVLSFRTAAYRLASFKKEPGFLWSDIMGDDFVHPNDNGFRLMADLAVWLIQTTALDLLLHPWDKYDTELIMEPLPPPMNPGNEALQSSMCAHQDDLRRLIVESATTGFTFVNEGTEEKPKKGYVAETAGAMLTLQVDTWRDGLESEVPVFLAHLRSYEHMGTALVKCVSGCTCQDKTVDAHQQERASQLYLAVVQATQHRNCTLTLTVQSETSSGEHKFKLGGVMLAEASNGQDRYEIPEGQWLMRSHAGNEPVVKITKHNVHNISIELAE